MSIIKPYARIYRPYTSATIVPLSVDDYLSDPLYANKEERESLLSAARLIVQDVIRLFDFVEPCDDNFGVYSHRIYELFLRCSTEFETNCKGVLQANHYPKSVKNMRIKDYSKLNTAMRLSDYSISCDSWNTQRKFVPFEDWKYGEALSWYQDYNIVKHNRATEFPLANLGNLMMALCGLIVLLAAQFDQEIGKVSSSWFSFTLANMPNSFAILPFTVYRPAFTEEESYEFDWKSIKDEPDPVLYYSF